MDEQNWYKIAADPQVERIARLICKQRRRDPNKLEPGNVPYHDDAFPATDGQLNGEAAFLSWREFVKDAHEILSMITPVKK